MKSLLSICFLSVMTGQVLAQTPNTRLVIRAQRQEVNVRSGIITVTGNVQMDYPARQIQATAAQAQYFTKEKRIVLRGDVNINQMGNKIKAETVTYLIEEGQFTAIPKDNQQVESVYIVDDPEAAANPIAATTPVEQVKPQFKQLVSPTIEIKTN
ncbi:MAG: LPS export ABC transporter periplasmic protein LptC [Cyanobacteria bacterium KgW148]|nr:LPS export ABC transporter periplasmic protein LptC [Cyanobacteria bacterium KgW148]